MTFLFKVDFENNNLFDYTHGFDSVVWKGGTIEVGTAFKYEGSYGCSISPYQGNYSVMGLKRVNTLTRFRQAFYIHPNGIVIASGGSFCIFRNYHGDNSLMIQRLRLENNVSLGYCIVGSVYANSGGTDYSSSSFPLDNQTDWNLIETDWYADDASGFFKLWINGSLKWNRSVINGTLRTKYPGLGAFWPSIAVSGSYFIDYWRANNDGSEIGA